MPIRYYILLFLCAIITPACLLSQSQLEDVITISIPNQDGKQLEIHDFIRSENGHLVLVGEARGKKRTAEAFICFVRLNADGRIESPELQYLGTGNVYRQVLRQIVQVPDGGFFALGEQQNTKNSSPRTWLVRFDEKGNIISPKTILKDGLYDYLAEIETGSFILAKKDVNDGNVLQLVDYEGKSKVLSNKLLDSNATSIVGLVSNGKGTVTICGNTNNESPWCKRIDASGDTLKTTLIDQLPALEIEAMQLDVDGSIILVGKQKKDGDLTWIAELNPALEIVQERVLDQKGKTGLGIFKDSYDQYFLLDAYETNIGYSCEIQLHSKLAESNTSPEIMEFEDDFSANHVLYTFQHQYVVAGNVGKRLELRYFTAPPPSAGIKSGDKPVLEITNLGINDPSGDKELSIKERAHLRLQIRNVGNIPVRNAEVTIEPFNNTASTSVNHQNRIYISKLSVGETVVRNIGLNGSENLQRAICKFKLIFKNISTSEAIEFPFEIITNGPRSADDFIVKYKLEEDNWERISRDIKTNKDNIEVKVEYQAMRTLTSERFSLLINGKTLDQMKDIPFTVLDSNRYSLTYNVSLKKYTENNIKIEIDDNVAPFEFNVLHNRKPNLHVFAITPSYEDKSRILKWYLNDLRSFVNVMKNQENRGIFNKVYIDTLVGVENTRENTIITRFGDYTKRFRDDKSLSDDIFIFYFSGHGKVHKGEFCLLPSDYNDRYKDDTTIEYKRILQDINSIDCHKFVFLDACHSGNAKAKGSEPETIDKAIEELNRAETGTITIVSSDEGVSYENDELQMSFFTAAIVDALNNEIIRKDNGEEIKCDLDKGFITPNALFDYIQEHMKYYTLKYNGNLKQVPDMFYDNGLRPNLDLKIFQPNTK